MDLNGWVWGCMVRPQAFRWNFALGLQYQLQMQLAAMASAATALHERQLCSRSSIGCVSCCWSSSLWCCASVTDATKVIDYATRKLLQKPSQSGYGLEHKLDGITKTWNIAVTSIETNHSSSFTDWSNRMLIVMLTACYILAVVWVHLNDDASQDVASLVTAPRSLGQACWSKSKVFQFASENNTIFDRFSEISSSSDSTVYQQDASWRRTSAATPG